ncbi:energy transducer TonB [Lysobacter sp. ESA13C]|uniref:energy transducer TonB n=1 Tax=Lysobacter sp. ESA13C TaxID=2862676 RepID=UPI001CBB3A0F|nr:energy transducer TonB [Lysobacter sp. ESA13C]
MKFAAVAAVALFTLSGATVAGKRDVDEVRARSEMSMVVTGKVRIKADGSVEGLDVDKPSELPKGVVELVQHTVPHWRFEPAAAGKESAEALNMSVRVVGRKQADGNYQLTMRSANFADPDPGTVLKARSLPPPSYPSALEGTNAAGTVYVLVRVGEAGDAQEVFAEQVNLSVVAEEKEMQRLRKEFARSAVSAAKRWKFELPKNDGEASAWTARVPVEYVQLGQKRVKYGQWEVYVPGPHQQAPWYKDDDTAGLGVDAFANNEPQLLGQGRRLLTKLAQE